MTTSRMKNANEYAKVQHSLIPSIQSHKLYTNFAKVSGKM